MTANRPRPRELYRDPARGRIAGVCAGLADYFGWPVWPVRLGLALLAIFTQIFPVVAAYLIAWFILDPISPSHATGLRGQMDDWVMKTRSRWDHEQGRPLTPQPHAPVVEPEHVEPASNVSPDPGQPAFRSAEAARSASPDPVVRLSADPVTIEACLLELENRVRDMERHVTEPAFVLRQQFRSL